MVNGRTVGAGALMLMLAACGGEREAEPDAGNGAASAANASGGSNAQQQVVNLPEGQRNGVLFRAIRDARQPCQNVESSTRSETSNNVPVYVATCEDGSTFAVAIADDGTATVQPIMPAMPR